MSKFHNVNCANTYPIHLMECILCNKQYVSKAEISKKKKKKKENLKIYGKDVRKTDVIMACNYFRQTSKIYHYRSVNEHF